jgi:hypothetical protein
MSWSGSDPMPYCRRAGLNKRSITRGKRLNSTTSFLARFRAVHQKSRSDV